MTEVIEFMTLGVCGLGAVVVTVMALFSSPTGKSRGRGMNPRPGSDHFSGLVAAYLPIRSLVSSCFRQSPAGFEQ